MSQFVAELRTVAASGGGDVAEDVPAALERVSGWDDWEGQARFVVLITDAPCHGLDFHADDIEDDRSNSSNASEMCFRRSFQNVMAKDLVVFHCMCNERATRQMHGKMKSILNDEYAKAKDATAHTAKRLRPLRDGGITNPYLCEIEMIKRGAIKEQPGMHTVFVLDESGSMGGGRWAELQQSYTMFQSTRRTDQGGSTDLTSIIQFGSTARRVVTLIPSKQAPATVHFQGGGTMYMPALEEAQAVLRETPISKTPQLVFMTDGSSGDNIEDVKRLMATIKTEFSGRDLDLHVIGFGPGAPSTLQPICDEGGGTLHSSNLGQLVDTFKQIALGASPSELLYKYVYGHHAISFLKCVYGPLTKISFLHVREIGERISESVQDRLILDFL